MGWIITDPIPRCASGRYRLVFEEDPPAVLSTASAPSSEPSQGVSPPITQTYQKIPRTIHGTQVISQEYKPQHLDVPPAEQLDDSTNLVDAEVQ